MNQLTASVFGSYKPQLALIVYKEESEGCRTEHYIESHPIDENGRLLEGRPLSVDAIEGMVGAFFDEHKQLSTIRGLIPEYVLFFDSLPGGKYKLIWYRPAQRRVLHFAESLKIDSGEAWVPPMLYVVNGGGLDVFALKEDTRPDHETILYRAPFHNVSENGGVCLGSARVKKPSFQTFDSVIGYWEEMFWNSEFSHLTGSKSPIKGNINTLWPELIGYPKKRFPTDVLMGGDKKLKSIIP